MRNHKKGRRGKAGGEAEAPVKKRGFDTKDFLENLRGASFPVDCPFAGCKKSYKSFRGVQTHLMTCHPIVRAEPVIVPQPQIVKPSMAAVIKDPVVIASKELVAKVSSPVTIAPAAVAKKPVQVKLEILEKAIAVQNEVKKGSEQKMNAQGALKRVVQMVTRNAARIMNQNTMSYDVKPVTVTIPNVQLPDDGDGIRKPSWMSKKFFDSVLIKGEHTINEPCLGCGKMLKQNRETSRYRLEDYIHMIEDCEEYRRLDLIQECEDCNCKFLLDNAYLFHDCSV